MEWMTEDPGEQIEAGAAADGVCGEAAAGTPAIRAQAINRSARVIGASRHSTAGEAEAGSYSNRAPRSIAWRPLRLTTKTRCPSLCGSPPLRNRSMAETAILNFKQLAHHELDGFG